MNFEFAISNLKKGEMVRRNSWLPGTFVFKQVPATISKEIVPKMQSLPDSVKAEFERRFNDERMQVDAIYYNNQLAIVNPSNLIESYTPSIADCLAEDWHIVVLNAHADQ